MTGLLAQEVAADAAANGTQQTTITFGHGWRVGIVVGSVRVSGLRGPLVIADVGILLSTLRTSLGQLSLVSLVLSVGVV